MRISFLNHHVDGIGGTIRATVNLANALAERHDVEIVSVFRHRTDPRFRIDPRVRLRSLVDMRRKSASYEGDHPLTGRPAKVFPDRDSRYALYSELTDQRIAGHLARLDADIVIGTRPGLNVHVAREAPRRLVRVGQGHLILDAHSTRLKLQLRGAYPRLDALVTVTEADAASYRRQFWLPGVRVEGIPNGIPDPGVPPGTLDAKQVVAVGRLDPVKRYGDLIQAFAKVRAERPDWGLKLYGTGPQQEQLARLVERLDLQDAVTLMGPVAPVEEEVAKGSVLAVSSNTESFGMTIVEAMRLGLPVVSTDCPLGPSEIIEHGVDGLLVPRRDPDALAGALLQLINDDARRKRMGRAALDKGRRYDPARIAAAYETLFQELLARKARPGRPLRELGRRASAYGINASYNAKDVAGAALRRVNKRLRGG